MTTGRTGVGVVVTTGGTGVAVDVSPLEQAATTKAATIRPETNHVAFSILNPLRNMITISCGKADYRKTGPPLTSMVSPVIYEEASEARKRTG